MVKIDVDSIPEANFEIYDRERHDPVAQTPNMFSDGRWVRATEFRLLSRMPESLFVGHYLATTKVSNKEQQILCTRETCLGSTLRDRIILFTLHTDAMSQAISHAHGCHIA